MTTIDPNTQHMLMRQALRERVADVGDEDRFRDRVLAAATALPQRKALHLWPVPLTRRSLVLVAALLATAIAVGAMGGALGWFKGPKAYGNGPVLVADDRRTWWMDAETGAEITNGLPELPSGIQSAAWSVDGERLAFEVLGQLEVFDVASGQRTILAECADIGWRCDAPERPRPLAWSPDGSTIAIGYGTALQLVDVATGSVTELVPRGDDLSPLFASPSWTPDGQWLVVEVDDTTLVGMGNVRQLHAFRRDGTERHRLDLSMPQYSLGLTQPSWPRGATGVIVPASDADLRDDRDADHTLRFVSLPVVDGQLRESPVGYPDVGRVRCVGCLTFSVAPDGDSVLIASHEQLFVARITKPGIRLLLDRSTHVLAWRPLP